jgi:hypothetical protein
VLLFSSAHKLAPSPCEKSLVHPLLTCFTLPPIQQRQFVLPQLSRSALFDRLKPEAQMTHPPEFVIYAKYCGMNFAELAAELFRADGFTFEIRPTVPQDHEGQAKPWGRIFPGVIYVRDMYEDGEEWLQAELRNNELALGTLGPATPKLPTVKVKVADKSDAVVHSALAIALVKKVKALAVKGWELEQALAENRRKRESPER